MQATLFSNQMIIGTCDLSVGDESMGCVYGTLVPNENYNAIRQNILDFNDSAKPDHKKWCDLRFNVQLETGYFLFPQGGFTFSDSAEFPKEPIRVDIAGIDLKMLELPSDYFTGPWEILSIASKIGLEDELRKEVEPYTSFWKRLFNNEHLLSRTRYSALARFSPQDDVLFEISGLKNNYRFAVVHLTWTHARESWPHFPSATYYSDLEEFTRERLMPDSDEYRYE